MRLFFFFGILSIVGGCTPFIPIVSTMGTSAAIATGNIPPEYLQFNNFGVEVDALVSDQLCATPYILEVEKSLRATPGELIEWSGRCEPYQIRLDNLAEHFSP